MSSGDRRPSDDPYFAVQQATRAHRMQHGCQAYTFEDGVALHRLRVELKAERVLELGTALGYTACCFAHADSAVRVDTIEGDALHVGLARDQISRHRLDNRITVHHGQFDEVLSRLCAGYDLAFFDGFAPPHAIIRSLRDLLRPGGVLICSNLQLASAVEERELSADFENAKRWQKLQSIEGGRTLVRRKI